MNPDPIQLALAHHKAGRLADAQLLYEQILAADPRNATVLNYSGVLAIQNGRFDLAIDLLNRAITLNPNDCNYRCNLGEALRRSSQPEAAIAAFREALRLDPRLAVAHNNLGITLASIKQFDDAVTAYRRAIDILPTYAQAHANLGNSLKQLHRYRESIAACETAVRLQPDNAEFHNQLGAAFAEAGDFDDAVGQYHIAIQIDPRHADAHSNLGNSLAAQGRVQDALASCETAVRLRPDSIPAHWNLAVALLRSGDYARGWVEHEWRLRTPSAESQKRFPKPALRHPAGTGQSLVGKTILLHAEQGFGDTIQFARFAPMVAALGGRIIIECQPELVRLFRDSLSADCILAKGEALPPFDEHAPLLSLPLILQIELAKLPGPIPYLRADDRLRQKWNDRLTGIAAGQPVLHIGLCWSGNTIHRDDRHRSIPLAELSALKADGVIFHSLQTDPLAGSPPGLRLIDHSTELSDFAETAALLANLDHLITVDTAVAHLAGAMGLPTSVLLASLPDWRWMLHRPDNPWYPTHRLYRQKKRGQWTDVLQRIAGSLRRLTWTSSVESRLSGPAASNPDC